MKNVLPLLSVCHFSDNENVTHMDAELYGAQQTLTFDTKFEQNHGITLYLGHI